MAEQFCTTDTTLMVRAPAKINLSLLVAGKRPDGFHEIDTVMAKVDLYDELLFEPGRNDGVELICNGRYPVSTGRENLVYQACDMLLKAAGASKDIKVTLTKNIPIGAGLGGGSSDAAAALIGLNRFGRLGFSHRKLSEMATRLGSDVSFFLAGPLAICRGRGEEIQQVREFFCFEALLLLPDLNVSTKKVYENYRHNNDLYIRLKNEINGYIKKKKIDLLKQLCANMLEQSCFEIHPELAELRARFEALMGRRVCLSGSGSAMFCMVTGAADRCEENYQSMVDKRLGCRSVIVHNNRW